MSARAALDAGIAELRKCPFIPKESTDGSLGTLAGVVFTVMREALLADRRTIMCPIDGACDDDACRLTQKCQKK